MYEGTITRNAHATMRSVFKSMLTRRDFESQIIKLKKAESIQTSQSPSVRSSLAEMFSAFGIVCEHDRNAAYYEELLDSVDLPAYKDIEKNIMRIMYDGFEDFATPQDYMLRIVNRLSEPDDCWNDDPLRLRILKQFIKYGNCLTYSKDSEKVSIYAGEAYIRKYVKKTKGLSAASYEDITRSLDDSVFDVLKTAKAAQLRVNGTYGLLKLANDLAVGVFKPGGATKRDLYMFAMVYGMTYQSDLGDNEDKTILLKHYESDIEKNLFEDYYFNNLNRFLTDPYIDKGKGDLGAFDLDPSGLGINYKNFAEMIYIYYISKDLEPKEKIRRSNEMIERVKKKGKKNSTQDTSTKFFTNLFTDEILKKSESEFEEFIISNYNIDEKAVLQLHTENKTAFELYESIIRDIEKDGLKEDGSAIPLEDCYYGLWFTDTSVYKRFGADFLGETEMDSQRYNRFLSLLCAIDRFLKNKKIYKKTNKEMTRTLLAVVWYYRYNQQNEKNPNNKSFIDVRNDYINHVNGLSGVLEKAGYQPISEKNIFDIALIFSSYSYIYERGEV